MRWPVGVDWAARAFLRSTHPNVGAWHGLLRSYSSPLFCKEITN